MRIDDRLWAVFFILMAVTIIIVASGYPRLAGMSVGPGLFPIVLGSALICASLMLVLESLSRAAAEPDRSKLITLPPELSDRRTWFKVSTVVASCALFALFGRSLGFVIVGVLALGALLLAFGTRPGLAAVIAVLTVLAIDIFFVRVMRIPLPSGLLSAWNGLF